MGPLPWVRTVAKPASTRSAVWRHGLTDPAALFFQGPRFPGADQGIASQGKHQGGVTDRIDGNHGKKVQLSGNFNHLSI